MDPHSGWPPCRSINFGFSMTDWFKVHAEGTACSKKHFFFFGKIADLVLMCETQRLLAYADKRSGSADKCAQDYIH